MSLLKYKKAFDNSYQEIFQKALVGKSVANLRFKNTLKYGESVERVAFDISNVKVRSTVRGSASTIDSIVDSSELLTINLEKEAVFHISDGEVTQAGALNPVENLGAAVAHLVSQDLDARILNEVLNASQTFDNGDLTTLSSDGTPITLDSTTVPQLVSRGKAKLRSNNQVLSNIIWALDSYAASDIEQYLQTKDWSISESTFKNGYAGLAGGAKIVVSENLTGEAVLGLATQPTAADTVIINGVTFTFVGTIGSTAGNVLIGADVDATRANLAGLINNPDTTSSTQVALSSADSATISETLKITATNDDTANTLAVEGIGSGRLVLSETLTDATDGWDKNYIDSYLGKKGGMDVVVQNTKASDMRPTDDRRGTNVFSSYLAGIKTFTDGSKRFLDVKLEA